VEVSAIRSITVIPRTCLCIVLLAVAVNVMATQPETKPAKLLIAFASTRDRWDPPYPKIHFYEHDGIATGKLLESIDTISKGTNNSRGDMHPSLSRDGRYCAFASQIGVANGGQTELWDRKEKKLVALPSVHGLLKTHQMGATMSADGNLLAFTAWAWPGASVRWNVVAYDTAAKKAIELPKLNHETADQRMPAFSADGRFLAYASNAKRGVGVTDLYLYDMQAKTVIALPEMNSKSMDIQPALSGDGRLIAFVSDRPGGAGGRDIYLYDRTDKKFLPLPGLNSPAPEQSPSLSADGRYLAFVSERLDGAGERDVYLYDRETQKLLPTPGLNSKQDDFDPCVIVLEK
jgi:Tol biopolymer transport system component